MKVKKALVLAAGSGTRFLPATKAQSKEMLPIWGKPTIQYAVEEVTATGVEDVIIVTSKNGQAIANHFDSNLELEWQLKKTDKKAKAKEVRDIAEMANFIFLRQKPSHPYGPATPVMIASNLLTDGPFFCLYGDDMTISRVPVCEQLLKVYKKNPDAAAVLATFEVPIEKIGSYSSVKLKAGTTNEMEYVVEKPDPKKAPSNMILFGRFLFTPKILPYIKNLKKGKGGEMWLTDAICNLAKDEKVLVHKIEGKWMTTGDPINMFKTSLEVAKQDPKLFKEVKKIIKQY